MLHQKRNDRFLVCSAVRYHSRCTIMAPPDSKLSHCTVLLILCQLKPRMNLKSNLLNFVIKVLGIISGNIDTLHIISGIIKLFTLLILPIKIRLPEDHKFKTFFVLCIKDSKLNSLVVFLHRHHIF